MKLIVDLPEKDFDFIKKTYKPTGYDFVARPLANEIISSVMNGTPFDSVIENREKAETKAYFDGQAYGWEQGRNDLIEALKSEIRANAEYHEDGEWYLNEKWIIEILDKHISGKENNDD